MNTKKAKHILKIIFDCVKNKYIISKQLLILYKNKQTMRWQERIINHEFLFV